MNARPIRLLIVDDSALARKIISQSLAPFPEIEVVGTATDPYVARDKILELQPDVLTLDIEMPRMDGITFLRLLMKHRPMPVIIMSSLTAAGSQKALEALLAGAVEVMEKPSGSCSASTDGAVLAHKIKAAAAARLSIASPQPTVPLRPKVPAAQTGCRSFPPRRLILLGASTGGTEALKALLSSLPGDLPGICVVQHIPAYFSRAFAERLNQVCAMEVREARAGDIVKPGLALVAPGGYHLLLKWQVNHYIVDLTQGPPLHHQRPAVDVLFDSATRAGAAPYTVAALLTGMGADGAAGLARLRQGGATTIAQNEETCVVFGMPREAIRLGAAQHVLPLGAIGRQIEHLCAAAETAAPIRPGSLL